MAWTYDLRFKISFRDAGSALGAEGSMEMLERVFDTIKDNIEHGIISISVEDLKVEKEER